MLGPLPFPFIGSGLDRNPWLAKVIILNFNMYKQYNSVYNYVYRFAIYVYGNHDIF